ncbi:L,D-transpeptidase family protein, partial [Streptomyces sp. NRRL WC-3549]|uniref:L,D-transpeptidase family protein n=1 Tax=Streptomyces sp. NRRL WC-3549 TaxID=1463925 RepID=UPI0004CB1CCF
MRRSLVAVSVVLALAGSVAATPGEPPPLPRRTAGPGGGSQLITAVAPDTGSPAPARFGAGGLTEGATRVQGTDTTPTGLYDLPYAFGTRAAPAGTRYPYRRVTGDSWWCQDNGSAAYNRWVEPRPADCRADEAEHLASYATQYARALVIGFNYRRPVRGRGAGIFLHVNGKGATAGCVSVPADAMDRILAWADPA